MTVTLADMADELATLVPAVDGTPTTAQYERAVRDAVSDLGYRVPRIGQSSLAIVSGTATYDLPAGFIRLISLEGIAGEVLRDGAGYLVPASPSLARERHTVSGGEITFHPTPAYSLSRTLRYAAGYPYDAGTDAFIGLTDDLARIAMLRARSLALGALSLATAGSAGLSYRIGDTSVQRTATQPYSALAAELDAAYLDAVKSARGFIGARGEWRPA